MAQIATNQSVNINARWALEEASTAQVANQILIQAATPGAIAPPAGPEGYYITLGHIDPPLFNDADDAAKAVADGIVFPVHPLARVYVPVTSLRAMYLQIGAVLEAGDAVARSATLPEELDGK